MRTLLILFVLVQACSSDKKMDKPETVSIMTMHSAKDAFETSDEVYFKQYIDEDGKYITEQQKVTYDYGSGKTKKFMFILAN